MFWEIAEIEFAIDVRCCQRVITVNASRREAALKSS